MTEDILSFAAERVAKGQRVALVTVTETRGSSPASAGQLMAVAADGTARGTVGGGATEYRTIRQAVQAMESGEKLFQFSFDHGENGMVCGGEMRGFGTILGNENQLYIFGGGHIGQSLASLAAQTGFTVTVIEDRPELESAFSGVRYLVSKPEAYETQITVAGSAYAVICTRGHQTDDEALQYCLKQDFRYIGMIGSSKKVAAVFERLRNAGHSEAQLRKVYTPIGLDIASSIPAEIAVAILAEILLIKNGGTLNHKRLTGLQD